MEKLKKALVAVAIVLAIAGTSNLVQANCGTCGTEEAHPHEHADTEALCVRCEHAKVCDAYDCKEAAHFAQCTCAKSHEDEDSKSNDYSLPESNDYSLPE